MHVTLQQDNARTHAFVGDVDVGVAGHRNMSSITLAAQPTNSPDLNILDLGFFRNIQSLR